MGTNSLQTSTPTGEKTQQQESQPCCRLGCCSCDSAVPDEPTWGDRTCLIVHYFRKVQAKPTRWSALSLSAAHVVPSLGHSSAEHWRCGPGQRCLVLPKNRLWFKTGHNATPRETCHQPGSISENHICTTGAGENPLCQQRMEAANTSITV